MIRSARISVSYSAHDARIWAISLPAGVVKSKPSRRLTSPTLRLSKSSNKAVRPASGAAQAVQTPADDRRHLARLDVRLQLVPAGPIHRPAGEAVLVPLDGLILGSGPPFQIGKLRAGVLTLAADAGIQGDMTHGAFLRGCSASMLRTSVCVKCDLKPTLGSQK